VLSRSEFVFQFRGLWFKGLGFRFRVLRFRILGFLIFIRTKLEYLEEFGDTLQFYFEDLGLKRMKMMKKRGNRE